MRIGVIGAGTWEMALSRMLSNTGHDLYDAASVGESKTSHDEINTDPE